MKKKSTKRIIKQLRQSKLLRLKTTVIMFLCVLSVNSIAQNCTWGSQSPAGTVNVSSTSQTIVGINVFPGTYSVENFTVAGQYALAASFGSYFTVTDNANNPIISGPNTLTVTIPSPGLYRIHFSANSGCGTGGGSRIVALVPVNRALDFDGVDDYVDLGTPLTTYFGGKTAITAEAWIYPTSNTGAYKVIIGNYNTTNNTSPQFMLRQQGNDVSFFIGNSSGSYAAATASNSLTLNSWQHVVGTWDGSVIKVYVNGVLGASTNWAGSMYTTSNAVYIGKNNFTNEIYQGKIDEVRVWDRALCQGEIQNNRNGEIPTTSTNLLANYHFNQGVASGTNTSVTSLTDNSGNSYTGTLTNFALTGSTSNWIAPGAFADGIYVTSFVSPSVSISGANGICLGASTTFTASGNVSTYNWLSGPTTATNSVAPTTTTSYSVVGTNSLGCLSNTATITLTVSSISTTSAVTNVSCNGGSNGSATVTATGGISPYTYLASNAATVSTLSGLTPGAYTYTVTDAISCTKTQNFTITQPSALFTSSAVTNVLCNGGSTGSATLTVSGGTTPYSYMASNGYTTSTLPSLVAGTYNYTVTDGNGCTKTQALTITQPTALSLTASANNATICSGASSTLTANGTGGTGTITYTWVGGPTNSTYVVSPTSPTNYSVNITDANSCTKSATVGVVANVCTAGAALNFAGGDDRVNLGNGITTSLTGSTKVSVEAWVKPTSLSGFGVIVGNYSTGSANLQILLRRQAGSNYEFWVGNGAAWHQTTSAVTPTVNVWQHVAATWNGTVASIYVNGVLSGTTTPGITSLGNGGSNPVLLAGNTMNENFIGDIDEVRIWNVVRTQCEINNYKNCEIPTSATGLLANYHFNQGTDAGTNTTITNLTDASASAYTGTITGMPLTGATSNWVAPGGVTSGSVTPANLAITVGSTVTNSAVCLGNSTTLSGTGANTYVWTGGVTNAVAFTPTVTNTYTVTGTNTLTGCTNTAVSSVTVNALPSVAASVTNVLCNGGTGSATVTATGGTSPYTYLASNGVTVSAQSGLMPGSYTYTVTDVNSCVQTQTLSITEPTAIVTTSAVTNALCNGGTGSATVTATGGTGAYTYLASNGATVSVQSGLMAGTYNYTVTDANACEQTQILSITEPTAINLSASANNATICAGASSTLTANATGGTGTLTYTWVSGPTNNVNTVTPTATAVYTVDVTDANNCAASSIVEVTVNSLPTISVNSGSICVGQSFTMVPTGAATYTYSNGTDVVAPTANDSYTVTGTDANGCVSATGAVSTVTVNALPVLTAVTNNTLLCVGQTATLSVSGATTYTWNTTENTASIAVSPTVQTTYTVNGTDANGCSNNTTLTQDVSACTGIATLTNDASINVYPNPNNGLFVIELTSASKVTVMNALGQVVIAETFEAGKHTVNINNEATGVYFVKVMTNNKQQIIKVIKE